MLKTLLFIISLALTHKDIDRLSSDCFYERSESQARLENLGCLAIPYIQYKLREDTHDLEQRERLKYILHSEWNYQISGVPQLRYIINDDYTKEYVSASHRAMKLIKYMGLPVNPSDFAYTYVYYQDKSWQIKATYVFVQRLRSYLVPKCVIELLLKRGLARENHR